MEDGLRIVNTLLWNDVPFFLLNVENADATPIQATNPIRKDFSPTFDLKGQYLYFLSQREYYPIIEDTHFNASFPHSIKPYLISLQADSPNPFKAPAPIPGHQRR